MEIIQVVVIENPMTFTRPPKAIPCCRVCFEIETHQKLFMIEDLECQCNPFLHNVCVQEWFRIAGREVCPSCGEQWKVVDSCVKYERCMKWFLILLLSISILTYVIISLYQIMTQVYMPSTS